METSKIGISELISYIEDLDFEASALNQNVEDVLMKKKSSNKITKEIYNILYNTFQSMKKGEIIINNVVVKPFEKQETQIIRFDVNTDDAKQVRYPKDITEILDNLPDWEVSRFNTKGTEFKPVSSNGDTITFNSKNKSLFINDLEYKLNKDFDYFLHIYNQGIYLFKKIGDELSGVTWARWSV